MEAAHHGRTTLKYALWVVISATFLAGICLAQDARQVAQKVLPSVVVITTYDSAGQPIMQASGFFVTENTVATNFHVIEGASEAKITLVVGNTNSYSVTGVVALNQQRDLVLLKVSNVRGVPLTIVSANQTEVGEEIYAVGNPKGFAGTISPGIVSSFGTRRIEGEDLLQVTTPISPGSSGGPIVNNRGEVIAIADASVSGGQNLNFAVPAAYLVSLIAQIGSSQPLSFVTTPKSARAAIDSNDWVLIDSVNDVALYYSPKHIERSGADTVQAWVKHVPKTEAARSRYIAPGGDEPPLPATFAYEVWKEEYDCRQSRNRPLSVESYDNHGKRLGYIGVPKAEQIWESIKPHSLGELELKRICNADAESDLVGTYTGTWASDAYNVSGALVLTLSREGGLITARVALTGSEYFNEDTLIFKLTPMGSGVWKMDYKGKKSKMTGTGLFRGGHFVGDYRFSKLLWEDRGRWDLRR